MDSSSGRNNLGSGSDSAKHYGKGTAHEQHSNTPKTTPVPAPTAEVVRDLKPAPVAGSLVK